jgi:predicted acyl esterase
MEKLPALIPWSPYGKTGNGLPYLSLIPFRLGIPESALSGLEKFEGPDPAEWCARGYVIVNIDSRGAFDSEGDLVNFGTQEGRDGYDVVEHLATLPWCNGSIGMSMSFENVLMKVGNSWLGIAQWFIASENPPHLKCIAPWEGLSDSYREMLMRGGIPYKPFWDIVTKGLPGTSMCSTNSGRNKKEDPLAMMEKYPFMNGYWADKRVKMSQIKCPAYITASYSTGLHTPGSIRGYREHGGERWLRIIATQEWYDLWMQKENADDLQKFYDRYLKGIDNGWEQTPRVRLSLLNFNKVPPVLWLIRNPL